MTIDMESRLRQALRVRAEGIEPDARTWEAVQTRLRRSRQRRLVLAGAAALAALAVVALGLPTLLGGGTIQLDGDPPVADQPPESSAQEGADEGTGPVQEPGEAVSPEQGSEPLRGESPRDPEPCHTPPTVAAVWSSQGDLWAACANGLVMPLTEGAAVDRRPAMTPGGDALVFERTEPGQDHPVLVYREFAEGADESVLGGGALPAIAPDGRLARVFDAGDGTAVIQISDLFSEPEYEASVAYPAADVRSLQWDPDGERLLFAVATEAGPVVWSFEPEAGHYQVVLPPDAGYLAVAFATDGTLAGMREAGDGDVEVVALDPAVLGGAEPEAAHTILPGMALADPGPEEAFLATAGMLEVEAARGTPLLSWTAAEEESWFVGDGEALYVVAAGGRAVRVAGAADGALANAAVRLGEQAHSGIETGGTGEGGGAVPAAVEETRRRLVAAAASGDLAEVRDLMASDFNYSFGAEGDRDGALAHFEANPELPGRLAEVLDTPHGVVEQPDGALYVWPRAHALDPGEWTESDIAVLRSLGAGDEEIEAWRSGVGYTGLRAGIRADGTWQFWVAGD